MSVTSKVTFLSNSRYFLHILQFTVCHSMAIQKHLCVEGWLRSLQNRYFHSQNVTWFGISIFSDITNMGISRGDHPALVGALNPMTVILRERKTPRDTEARWKWAQRELELCCQNQNNARHPRSDRGKRGVSPGISEGSPVLPTVQLQTSRPQNCKRMSFQVVF